MISRIAGGLILCRLVLSGMPASATIRHLIGIQHSVKVQKHATLLKIARQFEVNPEILARINHIKNGYVKPGRLLFLPTLHILPQQPREGIVLNIPERQVYIFRNGNVTATYPVAVGRQSWPTNIGAFQIQTMVINPQWQPTKNMIRREDIRDDPVPPGKENPVGDRWMGWSVKGLGFHSTISPETIGQAVSHGCVRLYPESAHSMFDLVKKGDSIASVYEPLLLGERDGRYYLSVFPDIYMKDLVSMARVRALLKDEGILSDVSMREVARALKNQDSYPRPISPPAPRNKVKRPAEVPLSGQTSTSKSKDAKNAAKGVQILHPLSSPNETLTARAIGTRLLAAYHNKHLTLLNSNRDQPQVEQMAKQGYLVRADGSVLEFAPSLLSALDALAAKSSSKTPFTLLSMYRPLAQPGSHEPHGSGLAADIMSFGGHYVDSRRPAASVNMVISLLRSLPPGNYRMGLPKPPGTDPMGLLAPPDRPQRWPFFPAPLPDVTQIGSITIVTPRFQNGKPVRERQAGFEANVLRWENERGSPRADLGDAGLKRAFAQADGRGVHVGVLFPDALNHLHLDVMPMKVTPEPMHPTRPKSQK